MPGADSLVMPAAISYVSNETEGELQELRTIVASVVAQVGGKETAREIVDWQNSFADFLPNFAVESENSDAVRGYTDTAIASMGGKDGRIYKLNAKIDNDFDADMRKKILDALNPMIQRIAASQAGEFVTTAKKSGLVWRRNRSLPFPHPLPYASPAPTGAEAIATEEAAVIEAAFHFPLSRAGAPVDLTIDRKDWPSSGGYWVLGEATVNSYHGAKSFGIRLNGLAFARREFDADVWAGTIAHEMLHNLGWGHPNGGYVPSVAIVNYDRCIRSKDPKFVDGETIEDRFLIR